MGKQVQDAPRNEVRLVGTVSQSPETRELPSGDELCVCRLVVPREQVRRLPSGRPGQAVDLVDLAAWAARPRRSMAAWSQGDEVEVRGALRRRFFQAGGRTASRVEVEVSSGRVVRRAASG
ncbi:single-stranded DNA-binding protein [Nocardioides sp. SYSU DS0651]|uniref:single-stranded DNA-binding protein n=1 Tax=Nocardioides sp. SYSU DS0651 TaxID=3415955 RepID=UPI003F4B9A2D